MITFIAFILTILGCVNWLLIGLLQYDFIAGLFGFQASIFSRLIYILFGIGAVYIVLRTIINKGSFKVYEKKKNKNKKEQTKSTPAYANTEAGKENSNSSFDNEENHQPNHNFDNLNNFNHENHVSHQQNNIRDREQNNNLFDEHFEK